MWLERIDALDAWFSGPEGPQVKLAKPWRSWKKLIRALNTSDRSDYKTATDDFRSKHTHLFTPRVELGITQGKRLPPKDSGKLCYGVGGSEPVNLENRGA